MNNSLAIKTVASRIMDGEEVKIKFKQSQSPGDILTLTASIRDLKKTYPNLKIKVSTTAMEIWENNPYLSEFEDDSSVIEYNVRYPLVNKSNSCGKHFIYGMKEDIEQFLGVSFELKEFKCDVHISDKEKGWFNQVHDTFGYDGPYWIINSGSKNDFPLKQWPVERWQEVVDGLKDKIKFVQVGEKGHNHQKLEGVFDLLGKTDMRQLIRLAYNSSGGMGHVSMLNHLLSCWNKPSVVVAGGRETSTWESYNTTQYIHTIGSLDCCASGGCWKSTSKDCKYFNDDTKIQKCMDIIKSQHIIKIVEKYI